MAISKLTNPTPNALAVKPMKRPRTEEELLELHEARAWQRILTASSHLGREVLEVTDAREQIRKHPMLAVILASAGGVLAGKAVQGLLRQAPHVLPHLTRRAGVLGLRSIPWL